MGILLVQNIWQIPRLILRFQTPLYLQDSVNSQQVQLIQTLTGRKLQRARILKSPKGPLPFSFHAAAYITIFFFYWEVWTRTSSGLIMNSIYWTQLTKDVNEFMKVSYLEKCKQLNYPEKCAKIKTLLHCNIFVFMVTFCVRISTGKLQ